jgi:hypothetical protein
MVIQIERLIKGAYGMTKAGLHYAFEGLSSATAGPQPPESPPIPFSQRSETYHRLRHEAIEAIQAGDRDRLPTKKVSNLVKEFDTNAEIEEDIRLALLELDVLRVRRRSPQNLRKIAHVSNRQRAAKNKRRESRHAKRAGERHDYRRFFPGGDLDDGPPPHEIARRPFPHRRTRRRRNVIEDGYTGDSEDG